MPINLPNTIALLPPINAPAVAPLDLMGQYFVTGTDTEIGKTTVTAALIRQLAAQGKACYAIKPVTAGLALNTDKLHQPYSEDAHRINQFASVTPPIATLAPILLATPCSPHIAAQLDGVTLQVGDILAPIRQTVQDYAADCVLIEGAGGWFTPINTRETLADVAMGLQASGQCPVIVVVGIKLGCLNHTILTLQAIWQAGGQVAMLVFNQLGESSDFVIEQITWLADFVEQKFSNYQTTMPTLLYHAYVAR